jgi:soluble lytic murein transglycosylase-like protein
MKKLMLSLIILISTIFINGPTGVAENDTNNNPTMKRVKREMYLKNMIQEIENESEILIPDYVDIKYVEYMYDLSKKLELPTRMIFRLIYCESLFIDTISSPKGAYGFMQVMPETYELYSKALCVDTLGLDYNCTNIYIGMNMLKDLYDYWLKKGNSDNYSWELSLACYNAGMGRVLFFDGIPPYKETIKYIEFILKEHLTIIDASLHNFLANR